MATFAIQANSPYVIGDRRQSQVNVTFSASVSAGGEAVTPANVGFTSRIDQVTGGMAKTSDGAAEVGVVYDATAKKLQAVKSNGTSAFQEATGDLSAYTARLTFIGV